MACLDTTILLDLTGRGGKRRQGQAREKVKQLIGRSESLVTTRFNEAELWVGVMRSRAPENEREAVQRLLSPLMILDFDEGAAKTFGAVVALLQARGRPIGDMDALIASVALANGQSVVTRNARHFEQIPDLVVECY